MEDVGSGSSSEGSSTIESKCWDNKKRGFPRWNRRIECKRIAALSRPSNANKRDFVRDKRDAASIDADMIALSEETAKETQKGLTLLGENMTELELSRLADFSIASARTELIHVIGVPLISAARFSTYSSIPLPIDQNNSTEWKTELLHEINENTWGDCKTFRELRVCKNPGMKRKVSVDSPCEIKLWCEIKLENWKIKKLRTWIFTTWKVI